MSVTATENFVMAAVLAEGESVLLNAASEPHVQDMCAVLAAMGAKIAGIGTSQLTVTGVAKLKGGTFTINTDHHEIVTFLALGAITGGEDAREEAPCHTTSTSSPAPSPSSACRSNTTATTAIVRKKAEARRRGRRSPPTCSPRSRLRPWPYFPVDLLPCMIALAVRAEGARSCSGTRSMKAASPGCRSWPSSARTSSSATRTASRSSARKPLRPTTVEAPYIIRAAVALYMVAASIPGKSVVKNADTIKPRPPELRRKPPQPRRRRGMEVNQSFRQPQIDTDKHR